MSLAQRTKEMQINKNETIEPILYAVNFSHLHYHVNLRGSEAISGRNFP